MREGTMGLADAVTVREVTALVVELGLVDPSAPEHHLEQEVLDQTLDYFGDSDRDALLGLLDHLGIRYAFDYKTFRGIDEADDAEREDWYREELQHIASCTRGLITIANVVLHPEGGPHALEFDCNGRRQSWPAYPGEDEDLEAALAFATHTSDLIPDGAPARWCGIEPIDPDCSAELVFGDPAALRRLGERFGVTFAD
jgi:hypothetical protein